MNDNHGTHLLEVSLFWVWLRDFCLGHSVVSFDPKSLVKHSGNFSVEVSKDLFPPWSKPGGTAAAAPLPFRPGNPALCGSRSLVTPYYCRLGDLLCYTCMLYLSTVLCVYACVICVFFVFLFFFLYSLFLQYFDTVGWVFWPVKTVSHITYTVLEGM